MSTIPKSLRDGLQMELLMNGNAKDTSGNGNDGTLVGQPTLTTDMLGRADRAYDFDGSNDYVKVDSLPNLGQTYSFSLFVKANRDNLQERLFEISNSTLPQRRIRIDQRGDTNSVRFMVRDDNWTSADYNSELEIDVWTFIVGTYDGSNMRLYIDGSLVDTTAKEISPEPTGDFNLGAGNAEGSVSGYFSGKIALPKIWNRALTQTEIQQLYIRGIGTGI